MKKVLIILLSVCLILPLSSCDLLDASDQLGQRNGETTAATTQDTLEKEQQFYTLAKVTSELLDEVAQDIYTNWYDAIYEDKFTGDINKAIEAAIDDNEDAVSQIASNTENLKELYKEVRDGKLHDEIQAVMQAYNDYHYLVLDSNCSFNEYKEERNSLKQALFKALDNLSLEL